MLFNATEALRDLYGDTNLPEGANLTVSLVTRPLTAVVRLIIRNLRPRSVQALKGVRIFIEKPDAGIRTPSGDSHFAGAFVLGLQAPESMLLNVAPTISTLRQSGKLAPADLARRKALRVTFVPDSAAALPKDFALTFESLTFEVPAKP